MIYLKKGSEEKTFRARERDFFMGLQDFLRIYAAGHIALSVPLLFALAVDIRPEIGYKIDLGNGVPVTPNDTADIVLDAEWDRIWDAFQSCFVKGLFGVAVLYVILSLTIGVAMFIQYRKFSQFDREKLELSEVNSLQNALETAIKAKMKEENDANKNEKKDDDVLGAENKLKTMMLKKKDLEERESQYID